MRKVVITAFDEHGQDSVPPIVEEIYGDVLVHTGARGYIEDALLHAPPDMEFTLIERHQRKPKEAIRTEKRGKNLTVVHYNDGTEELFDKHGRKLLMTRDKLRGPS